MTAKIITVCNQKGGSGKTTVSMQLAGALARRGNRVLVVDADPQGTASRWAAQADDNLPFPATVISLSAANAKVHREVQRFLPDYAHIVIDCPPAADSPIPQSALLVSDLALVPVVPSPLDLWAAVGIRKAIDDARRTNDALQARLVLNQCQPRASLTQDVLGALSGFGVEACDSRLGHRAVYKQSAGFGQTVHDMGTRAAPAVNEIEALASEVLRLLSPPKGRTKRGGTHAKA